MNLLQIRQTPALIGIDADPGQLSIRQPKADLQITTHPGEMEIHQEQPNLTIDQSRAWAAYNGGNFLEMNKRIYSGIREIFLEGIANRVEKGNRMAAIQNPNNTVAEIWGTDAHTPPLPEFRGPASIDNVDIHFDTFPANIYVHKAEVEINVTVYKPEIDYARGKLDIYMRQQPSVKFIPPEIDVTM